jgi:hypothetical protein
MANGYTNLREITEQDSLFEFSIDENWSGAINPWSETVNHVLPFHAKIVFNGWPAGLISPFDGVIAAGMAANEETFISAIRKQMETKDPARPR